MKGECWIFEHHTRHRFAPGLNDPAPFMSRTVQGTHTACIKSGEVISRLHNELSAKIIGEVVQPLETLRGNLKSEFKLVSNPFPPSLPGDCSTHPILYFFVWCARPKKTIRKRRKILERRLSMWRRPGNSMSPSL